LSAQPDADASALREDLKTRRARLMAALGDNAMAILWSAPARVYSRDVDYEYRQDSDLLYLTGVEQPDTILVLLPGSRRRKEILFVRPPNARLEHYVGRFLTTEEARFRTGIETVFSTAEFEPFLAATFSRRPYGLAVDEARDNDDHDSFFRALDQLLQRHNVPLGFFQKLYRHAGHAQYGHVSYQVPPCNAFCNGTLPQMLSELHEVATRVRTRIARLVLSNKRYGFLMVASIEPEDFLPKRRKIRHTHFCAGIEGRDKTRLEVNLRIHLIGVCFHDVLIMPEIGTATYVRR
jgi:hypothetical protein